MNLRGEPAVCSAEQKACPRDHFYADDEKEAQEQAEQLNNASHPTFSPATRRGHKRASEGTDHTEDTDTTEFIADCHDRGLFAPVTEDSYDVDAMIAENTEIRERDDEAHGALQYYSFIGFQNINSYLRDDRDDENFPDEDRVLEVTEEKVEQMDRAFAQHTPTGETHRVLRHITIPEGQSAVQYAEETYPDGKRFTDASYVSTTHSPSCIAEQEARRRKRRPTQDGLVFQICTEDGISMQSADPKDNTSSYSIQDTEYERLLPRGREMIVAGRTTRPYAYDPKATGMTETGRIRHSLNAQEGDAPELTTVYLVDASLYEKWKHEEQG